MSMCFGVRSAIHHDQPSGLLASSVGLKGGTRRTRAPRPVRCAHERVSRGIKIQT